MKRVDVEAFEDRTRPEGGHAVILLRGVMDVEEAPVFRLRLVEAVTGAAGQGPAWADQTLRPLTIWTMENGLGLVVGPDLTDSPQLTPGAPLEIVLPGLALKGEFLWPAITPLARPKRRSIATRKTADAGAGAMGAAAASQPALKGAAADSGTADATIDPLAPFIASDTLVFHAQKQQSPPPKQPEPAVESPAPQPEPVRAAAVESPPQSPPYSPPPSEPMAQRSPAAPAAAVPAQQRPESKPEVQRGAAAAVEAAPKAVPRATPPPEPASAPIQTAPLPPVVVAAPAPNPTPAVAKPVAAPIVTAPARPPAVTATATDSPAPAQVPLARGLAGPATPRPMSGAAMLAALLASVLGLQALSLLWLDVKIARRGATPAVPAVAATASPQPAAVSPVRVYAVFARKPVSPRGVPGESVTPTKALERAHALMHGAPNQRDTDEAVYWMQHYLQSTLGSERTRIVLTQLGSAYAEPSSRLPEFGKARLAWELAAAVGDPVAMCFLGAVHERGLGVVSDRSAASEWYKLAKDAGGNCPTIDPAGPSARR